MKLRTRLLLLAVGSLVVVGSGGLFLTAHMSEVAWQVARDNTDGTASFLRQQVEFYLEQKKRSSVAMAGLPELAAALDDRNGGALAAANRILDHQCESLKAAVCYLMAADGTTVASSNRNTPVSFVGKNYGFRPYFKQALAGSPAIYLALGVTSRKRGIYFGAPVTAASGAVVGVAVVKYGLQELEWDFSRQTGTFALVDPTGIVFASNRADWKFRSLSALTQAQVEALRRSKQFGGKTLPPVGLREIEGHIAENPDGQRYLTAKRTLAVPKGWEIQYLIDTRDISRQVSHQFRFVPVEGMFGALFLIVVAVVFFLYRSMSREIVGRQSVEAVLKESEEKYRLLFEMSEDPMWVIIGNMFMIANQAAARTLGYDSVPELINIHPSKVSPPFQRDGKASFDKANEMMAEAYRKGYHRFEWDHVRENGEVFPVEVSLTRIPFENEDALFCVWRDITESKKAAADLARAKEAAEQAKRAMSEFLAHMSHELRTPLNSIIGFSQLILTKIHGDIGAKNLEYTRDINRSADHLLQVINDILDISKIEAGEFALNDRDVDIRIPIDGAIRIVGARLTEKRLNLSKSIAPDASHIRADDRLIRQIVVNLLSNAIKFTPEGGDIDLAVERAADGGVTLRVTDTGIGIAPENIDKVVEPFGQVRQDAMHSHEGTGLGLSLTRKLAELHGGALSIVSEVGHGTTVTITFPPERTLA